MRSTAAVRLASAVALGSAALLANACDDNGGTGPGTLRFGWVGEVTVELRSPLRPSGELTQVINWRSDGFWTLREEIAYRGLVGDENVSSVQAFGDAYAVFVTQINETAGLKLIDVEGLAPGLDTLCTGPVPRTDITVSIRDDVRGEVRSWSQCADGRLDNLVTEGAGPRPEAARLVQAIQQVRDRTVGKSFLSAYHGSVPFGTLSRGEDSRAAPRAPFVITDPGDWSEFWLDHAGSGEPPAVDFDTEMVIVGAVGERGEAGVNVEVRRILQVFNGTLTHLVERIPGDFCSPVARRHYPFHIVVAPLTPTPIQFAEIGIELVPCGV